ncbi:hypothetical protein SAMD00079811_08390 [Scytonema sp. HK-05]|uniref:hypothetical protein n=1 Tax=Scytonema sp. HK-05 TaxID=1137095 RepID=UPI000AE4D006|nr:hypothetical protein [Scytonema sp. HK-05]BAY43260.1 hypothetical protein SAMD00079811_08390 [Scytonema sp. HK-05]
MSKLVILAGCLVLVTVSTAVAQTFVRSNQSTSSVVVQTDNGNSHSNQSTSSVVVQTDRGSSHNSHSNQSTSSVVVQTDSSDDDESSEDSFVVPTDDDEDENIQDSSVVISSGSSSDMNRSRTFSSQHSSSGDSFGYQKSSLTLSAANLSKPHILSINTSGAQMTGEITVNGKVVKQISNDKNVNIDLSRYLSVGEQKVEISARYNPPSSSVSVELSGPGTNVTQQNSGNGALNYSMDVSVR